MKQGKEELRREKEQESKKKKEVLGFFSLFLQVERKEDEVDGRECLKKK